MATPASSPTPPPGWTITGHGITTPRWASSRAVSTAAGGLNRYAYVGGNPDTATDPSGQEACFECNGAAQGNDWFNNGGVGPGTTVIYDLLQYTAGLVSIYHDAKTILTDPNGGDKLNATADLFLNVGMDVLMFTGAGEAVRGMELVGRAGRGRQWW